MSEEENAEVQETEETTETGITTLEDALKALEKVRKEAGSRRIKNKELEEKAAKYDEFVQSQKTELERLTEGKSKAEAEVAELRERNLRNEVVLKTDLDPELAGLLHGTLDEMEATAKLLVAKGGKRDPGTPKQGVTDFFAGQRGKRVAPAAETLDEYFIKMWKES